MRPNCQGITIFQLFILIKILFLSNFITAQCIINITDGVLGSYSGRTNYLNCTINVSTKLSLRGNISFKDCVFNMGPNAEINMHKPTQFYPFLRKNYVLFDHCIIQGSSSTKWKGINVASGSYLNVINSTEIKDALIGINGAFQSNCRIVGSRFSSCNIGMNFPNLDSRFNSGTYAAINLSEFSGNRFSYLPVGIKVSSIIKLDIGLNANDINEFEAGGTGILVVNSNVDIYNCRFNYGDYQIDIVNNLSDNQLSTRTCNIVGLGENSISTFTLAQEKSIRVYGNWQTVNIRNAKFENRPHNNSIDIESINNGAFNIENNTFKVSNQSGIYGSTIYIRNSSALSYSRISGNTFLEPFEGNINFAIQLVNLRPSKVDVSYNKLYGSDEISNGIKVGENASPKTFCSFHAENCNNVIFSANSLKMGGNASNNSPWVMHHMAGNSCRFESNIVTNETFTSNRQSIRLEGMVSQDILCNNTVKNSFRGIIVENNSPGTKIQSNTIIGNATITNNQLGLTINGNIPVQKHEGNSWSGSNFQFEAFIKPSLIVDDKTNKFVSRNDNYNLPNKYWPTLINRPNWFQDDKTVNFPYICQVNHVPTPCIDYTENRYLSDSSFRGSLSQGELWDNDAYFYRFYSENPGCLIYSDQINLFDSLSNSNLPDYLFVERKIDEFYHIDSNFQMFIDERRSILDSIILELSNLYNGIDPEDSLDVDSTIQSNIDNLEEILTDCVNGMDSILRKIDSLRSVEIGLLFTDVQSLSSYNSYDSLYKMYFYLATKKLSQDTLTEHEYEYLFELSRLCPSIYGNIAYLANTILPHGDHLESLSENCMEPVLLIDGTSRQFNLDCDISIFPNPMNADRDLIINSNCTLNSLEILDIYGKALFVEKLEEIDPMGAIRIHLGGLGLSSGVYLVVGNLKNGNVQYRKIYIN